MDYNLSDKLIYTVLLLVTIFGGHFFVKVLIKPFIDERLPKGFPQAGKYIGILERMLYWVCLSMGQASLIGFILTIKAIYRFGDIKGKPEFTMKLSEYFIIGTLLSLGWTFLWWGLWKLYMGSGV